jgi:hypothetical protein
VGCYTCTVRTICPCRPGMEVVRREGWGLVRARGLNLNPTSHLSAYQQPKFDCKCSVRFEVKSDRLGLATVWRNLLRPSSRQKLIINFPALFFYFYIMSISILMPFVFGRFQFRISTGTSAILTGSSRFYSVSISKCWDSTSIGS